MTHDDDNKNKKNHTFKDSFDCALEGIMVCLKEERNMRTHFICALLVIVLGFIFQLTLIEWVLIILAIFIVIISEMLNTIIENMIDFISLGYSDQAKKIKDIAAGSVLMSALLALILGLLIFGNKILKFLI